MKTKITQKQMAFYKLYKSHKSDPEAYLKTWEFVGEMPLPELSQYAMMSYKCPARLSDIYNENPGLLERNHVKGKSGANYYEYRIVSNTSRERIAEQSLLEFYDRLRSKTVTNQ